MSTVLRHIPNAITVARILACLPLAWVIINADPRLALWLALLIGVSDLADGFLARRFNWQSRIGGLLDPIADKLFLVSAVVALGIVGALPMWLIGLIVLRDLVIVAGAFAYHRLVEPLVAAPSVPGKFNTLTQVILVVVLLADRAGWPVPDPVPGLVIALVALLAVVSGCHYVWTWTARARAVWCRR